MTNAVDSIGTEQLSNSIVVKAGTDILKQDGVMQRIAMQIAELRKQGIDVHLVSSGAVHAGSLLLPPEVAEQMRGKKQALSGLGQNGLMQQWREYFAKHGIECAQALVEEHDFDTEDGRANIRGTLEEYKFLETLWKPVVPIFNGNDFVTHGPIESDNDKIAGRITEVTRSQALVLLTNVDGLFTGDPAKPSSTLIREIDITRDDFSHCIVDGKSKGGTGGMRSKYDVGMRLPRSGIDVHITNGKNENSIFDALAKEKGTWFHG